MPGALQMLQFGIADFKQRFEKLNSGEMKPEKFHSNLPKNLMPVYKNAIKTEKTQKACLSEIENSVLRAEQVSKTEGLGNLPLLVLSAGNSFASFISADERNKSMLENLNKGWM